MHTPTERRALHVAGTSQQVEQTIVALRAVHLLDWPALWVGIAEDTLSAEDGWAVSELLSEAGRRVGSCAHSREIRDGRPEL